MSHEAKMTDKTYQRTEGSPVTHSEAQQGCDII